MRELMYNRVLFILHKKKRQTLTVSLCYRKKKYSVVSKMLNFLILVHFMRKLKILILSYSTINLRDFVMNCVFLCR